MLKVFWISWSAHHHVIGRVNGIWTFLETFSLQANGSKAILVRKRVLNMKSIKSILSKKKKSKFVAKKFNSQKELVTLERWKRHGCWSMTDEHHTETTFQSIVNVGGHQFYVRVPSKHCWWCWCSSSDGSKCDGLKMRLQRWRSEGYEWGGGGNEFKNKQKIMPQLVACSYTHTILGTLSSWA